MKPGDLDKTGLFQRKPGKKKTVNFDGSRCSWYIIKYRLVCPLREHAGASRVTQICPSITAGTSAHELWQLWVQHLRRFACNIVGTALATALAVKDQAKPAEKTKTNGDNRYTDTVHMIKGYHLNG